MKKKLLVLFDIHYPIGDLATINRIIKAERPDNVVLLGDNIELERFKDHRKAYIEFFSGFNKLFPLRKCIVMLGDNDYQYASDKSVGDIVQSYGPMNKTEGSMLFFKKGTMGFFHGNMEKNKVTEKFGYYFVLGSNKISYRIAPKILSSLSRLYFGLGKNDYMFLGHLHYLGIMKNTVFCGTLNYEFMPFPKSLGYVTLSHEEFVPLRESIKLHRVNTYRSKKGRVT